MMIFMFNHLGCFLPSVIVTRKQFASFMCFILKCCLFYFVCFQQYPDVTKFGKDLHFTISIFNQLQNFLLFFERY